MTQIVSWNAKELSFRIHNRDVSCVEVMRSYLNHINRVNPYVNAIVSLQDSDHLIREAQIKDDLLSKNKSYGWMHGFPIAPKDLSNTAGIKTSFGSPLFENNIPAEDGLMIERMRRSGAIFYGKSNTPEFGFGSQTYNPVFGVTGNAFDNSKNAGGSSGGAAVALATHMMPVADGSDMMGSLRNPAAYNNIFGFRPSQGRVPAYPAEDIFYQQLSTEGPMGRSIEDIAMLLSVQSGWDIRVPMSIKEDPVIFTKSLDTEIKGTRIGWLGDLNGYLAMEDGILMLCESALKVLETDGVHIENADIPYSPHMMWDIWIALRQYQSICNYRSFVEDFDKKKLLKPEAIWEIENGSTLSVQAAGKAMLDRSMFYQSSMKLFDKYDFLAIPTSQCFPFSKEVHWPTTVAGRTMDTYHRWMEVVIFASLMGCPAISVPVGFNQEGGAMGMQLIGKPQSDFSTLQIAHEYDKRTSWVTKKKSPYF